MNTYLAQLVAVLMTVAPVAFAQVDPEPDLSVTQCVPMKLTRSRILHPQVPATLALADIQFPACDGKLIRAYLIAPARVVARQHPAILYVHWFDPAAADSNREQFVAEAVAMANKGAVTLLVSTFWSVPGGYYDQRRWQDDYKNTLNQARDLRRALQLLREQTAVDGKRIALVGHDYGAVFSAIIAPAEPGLAAQVLIAGTADIASWYLYGSASGVPAGDDLQKYRQSFNAMQPVASLAKFSAPVLLQFAQEDQYISVEQKQQLHAAAPAGSLFKMYQSDHAMRLPQIRADREKWLAEKLHVKQ